MKKLALAIALLTTATVASAHDHGGFRGGYHGGYYGGYHGGGGWVAPAIIGGVIGYELAHPYYYAPPPVTYVQPPVVYQQPVAPVCTYGQNPVYFSNGTFAGCR